PAMRARSVSYDGAGSGRPAGRPRERLHWRSPQCLVDRPPRSSRGHPMTTVRTRWSRVAQVFLPVLAIAVAGCAPSAVTSQGHEISDLYNIVFLVATAIFLFVEGLIIWAVLRYRHRPSQTELPAQIHGNNALEIIWTVIPTVIVAVLFFLSWNTLNHV